MRALLDTNIFISYLLDPEDKKLSSIIDSAFQERYTLVLPQEIVEEFGGVVGKKPYLVKYIPQRLAQQFIEAVSSISDIVPTLIEPIPQISRDKKDDYLLAYGLVGNCDYLVSGDKDLLIIQQISTLKIVSPSEFYTILSDDFEPEP